MYKMPHFKKPFINRLLFLFGSLILLGGCSKTDEDIPRLSDINTPILTGFTLRDDLGVKMRVVGVPNVVNSIYSNDIKNPDYEITFFPNPAFQFGYLDIKTPQSNTLKKVWIVKGKTDDTSPNASIDMGMQNGIIGGQPLLHIQTRDNVLEFQDLPDGYYRIYVKVDSKLLYENIIIKKIQ